MQSTPTGVGNERTELNRKKPIENTARMQPIILVLCSSTTVDLCVTGSVVVICHRLDWMHCLSGSLQSRRMREIVEMFCILLITFSTVLALW